MFIWNSLAILKKNIVDEFSKLVHTIKSPGSDYLSAVRHGLKETKCLAVKLVHRISTESHIETC